MPITIDPGRVYIGWKSRLDQTFTQSDVKDIEQNGPIAVVGPTMSAEMDTLKYGPAYVPIHIYLYKSKAVDDDLTDVDDLINTILDALTTLSTYQSYPGSIPPKMVRMSRFQYDYQDHKGLVCLIFSAVIPDP